MQHSSRRSKLELFGPEATSELIPKALEGAFCVAFRAEDESADETDRRARRRRFSGESGGGATQEDLG
eukprot:9538857-Alexandrium_andersonii.AAC.1